MWNTIIIISITKKIPSGVYGGFKNYCINITQYTSWQNSESVALCCLHGNDNYGFSVSMLGQSIPL
jgi:hypothetical protein